MQGHDIDRDRTETGWSQQCAHCKKTFESKRADATFCSPRCRKQHQREVEKWEKWILDLSNKGEELVEVAHWFRNSKRVYAAYLKLQRDLVIAIEEFENV